MFNSQYYTCEQIDQRLLQGYLDDYNSQNNTNLTKEQFLTLLFNTIGHNSTVDNLVTQMGYYECDTAAGTAAKTITVANYNLFAGGSMKVKFVNKNTANNATLNINSQGAKALYYQGERASSTNSWDEGEVVEIYYDGTSYYANNVKGGSGSGVYDVSVEHPNSGPNEDGKFTLEYILSNVDELIPINKRYPGMSIQFVSTSDNNYVKFFCTADEFTTDVTKWRGVDDTPIAGSNNLIESGGVDKKLADYTEYKKEAINTSAVLTSAYVGPQTVEDTIRIYTSQSSNNKVLAFNIKDKKLISIFVPKASKATGAVALAYTNEDLSTGEWSETRSISGEYIDIQISSVNGHTVITNDDNYKYVLVSCNYSDVANIPVVASVNTIEYNILNEKIDENTAQLAGSITDSLNEAKTYSDFNFSKYNKTAISESSIVSSAYMMEPTQEGKIRLNVSTNANNRVLFFDIKDKKTISVLIPHQSSAYGGALWSALAFTGTKLETQTLDSANNIKGVYLDTSSLPQNNARIVIKNSENYQYLAVCCNYTNDTDKPVVAECKTEEYTDLIGKIEDAKTEAEKYSDFNFSKYNKTARSEISIVSYAYITAPTTEGNVRINKSSAAKNKVIFYDIQGLNILSVVIPDTSGVSASSLYSFLALTNEKIDTSDLSKAKNLSGIYIDTSSLPRYDVKTLVKNTGNYKYLAVFATVNSNDDMPTVSECKTDEYIKLNQQIQDTNTALDNYKGFVAECNENDLIVIPCGKNTQPHPTVWTCFIDDDYSYLGYRAKFSRIKHHSTGVVEIVSDVELSGGDASLYEEIFKYHIVTGIATDANYIYISTRDQSVGTDTPLSGVGGYLMIYNKSTLALVKKVELVDSSNPIYKGMQCYLYKNNYLIIPLQKRGWCMYDITDVNNPTCQYHQSSIEHQHCKYWSANNHDYAAFTCFGSGVIIWDITDLSNVSVIGRWEIEDTIEEPQHILESFAIALNYPYLYVTVAPTSENMQSEYAVKGVVCFDVTNPATFNTTAKLSEIPRSYWGTTQDADGQPNNMAFYGNVIAVNLDGKGLGVFSADGDNVEFVKVITYNTFIRPITVSKDGLFMAGGQYLVVYNRFMNAASINSLIEDVKYLKSVIQNLT